MIDFEEPLSPQGEHRREQILQLALRQARRRRQRPRIVAGAIATASILLVIIGMHWFNRISPQTQNPNIPIAINTSHPSDIVIGQLDTDPTISERLALKPTSPRWEHLNDDELIESLADAGEKAGLIQTDGKTELLTDALQPHSLTGD